MADTILLRNDLAAVWQSVNPTLRKGEYAFESDTRFSKLGDGVTPWNALPYSTAPGAGGGSIVGPSIVTQPIGVSSVAGSVAVFAVIASGSAPLLFQWQRNTVDIVGATSASYSTPNTTLSGGLANNGDVFRCVISNAGGSVVSAGAVLVVTAAVVAPTVAVQPIPQSAVAPSTATFSVVAAGSAPLAYQWRKNVAAITGATSSSYTTPATSVGDNGASFDVLISNSAGSVYSTAVALTVTAAVVAPTFTTQPANASVTTPATATFMVVAAGTAPIALQWRKNGLDLAGATSASYTTPATSTGDTGAVFTCFASNSAGSALSTGATLTVSAAAPALAIAGTPATTGNIGNAYSSTFTASNGTAPYTYSSVGTALPAGLSLNAATGAITGQPTTAGATAGIQIRATDAAGAVATGAAFTITVAAALQISGSPATTGQVGVAYSFTPAVSGGVGTKTFSLAAGTLPAGLSLNTASGAITGTPTTAAAYAGIQLRVTDSASTPQTSTLATFTITVAAAAASATSGAIVSGRTRFPTASASVANLTASQNSHWASPEGAISNLVFTDEYLHIFTTALNVPGSSSTTNTYRKYVEYPQNTFTPVLYSGAQDLVLSNTVRLVSSDPLAVTIPASAQFWEHTVLMNSTTGTLSLQQLPAAPTAIGSSDSVYTAGAGGVPIHSAPDAGITRFGSSLITGTIAAPNVKSYFVLGDSGAYGLTDDTSVGAKESSGWVERWFAANGKTVCNTSKSGIAASDYATLSTNASFMAFMALVNAACTHVMIRCGGNDLNNSRTQAALLADYQTIYNNLFPGKVLWIPTLTPRSTSTDSWATTANQTPATNNNTAAVNPVNDAIRAGLPNVSYVPEVSDIVSSARNSGRWLSGPTLSYVPTVDGIHANSARAASLAAMLAFPATVASTAPRQIVGAGTASTATLFAASTLISGGTSGSRVVGSGSTGFTSTAGASGEFGNVFLLASACVNLGAGIYGATFTDPNGTGGWSGTTPKNSTPTTTNQDGTDFPQSRSNDLTTDGNGTVWVRFRMDYRATFTGSIS